MKNEGLIGGAIGLAAGFFVGRLLFPKKQPVDKPYPVAPTGTVEPGVEAKDLRIQAVKKPLRIRPVVQQVRRRPPVAITTRPTIMKRQPTFQPPTTSIIPTTIPTFTMRT